MAQQSSRYTVDVRLNPENGFPATDKSVIWDASSGSFEIGDAPGGGDPNIYEAVSVTNAGDSGKDQFTVLSQTNDGTASELSGSSDVVLSSYNINSNGRKATEFRINSSSANVALASYVPIRLHHSDNGTENQMDSYEYVAYREYTPSAAGTLDLVDISIPAYNYGGVDPAIRSAYNAVKIEHSVVNETNRITQYLTVTMAWLEDSGNNFIGLQTTTIENNRVPNNKVIIDPRQCTGSFASATSNLTYNVYHYNVSGVSKHKIRYTLL